jgi:hypothetical protein
MAKFHHEHGCTFFGSLGCATANRIVFICCQSSQGTKVSTATGAPIGILANHSSPMETRLYWLIRLWISYFDMSQGTLGMESTMSFLNGWIGV